VDAALSGCRRLRVQSDPGRSEQELSTRTATVPRCAMEAVMADQPTDRPPKPEALPADVRDESIRLLHEELSRMWESALGAGTGAAELAQIVDERRRALDDGPDEPPTAPTGG